MALLQVEALRADEVAITGPEALLEWRERHRLKVPGHEWSPRFKRHQWDGTWTPGKWVRAVGDQFELRCSRGLLPRVARDVGEPLEFNVVSAAEIAEFFRGHAKAASLWEHQTRAITRVLSNGWGRVAFATNAGKGAVIALLALFAEQRGERALILCDEIAVYDALLGELETWGGMNVGEVRAGVKTPPWQLVTLAMVPSLSRRLGDDPDKQWVQWLAQQRMVLCDEADKADAKTWRTILGGTKNTTWRGGFSGSFPEDLYHELRFEEILGPVLDRVKNAEMIEQGVSAKPSIEIHAFDCTLSFPPFPKGWWQLEATEKREFVYTGAVICNEARHQFIRGLIRPDTPTVVVVNRLEHGRALTDAIPGAVFLDGSSSETARLAALEQFREGTVRVLVVTKILDRGTNRLGWTQDLIFASSEGSVAQTLQRIGRGLRRAGGKEALRLVDVVDRINPRGDKKRTSAASFLKNAARRRLMVYAKEGFEVQLVPWAPLP